MTGFESAISGGDRDFQLSIEGDAAVISSLRRAQEAGRDGGGWVRIAQRFARSGGVWQKLDEEISAFFDDTETGAIRYHA